MTPDKCRVRRNSIAFLTPLLSGYLVPLALSLPNPLLKGNEKIKKSRYSPGGHGLF
jgi:hypothetical protein